MYPAERTFNGKKFVPLMLIGFVLFTIVGLLGTFGIGKAVEPFFKKRHEDMKREMKEQEAKGRY